MAAESDTENGAVTDPGRFFELVPYPCAVVGAGGKLLAANPAWDEVLARQPGELVGARYLDLVHPGDQETTAEALERAATSSTHIAFENRLVDAEGQTRWLAWRARAGAAHGTLELVARDITADIENEAALRAGERRFQLVLQEAPVAVVVHTEGRIVYANDASIRLVGATSVEEVIGRPVMEFVHPEYRSLVIQRIRRVRDDRVKAQMVEERFQRLDGGAIDVEVVAAPVTFGGRKANLVVMRDVTARKQAERALRASEQRLEAALDSIGDAVLTTDLDDHVVLMNPVAEQMTGIRRDEGVGKPFAEVCNLVPDVEGSPQEETPSETLSSLVAHRWSAGIVGRQGRIRPQGADEAIPVAIRGAPLLDDDGEVTGAVLVLHDVREERRAQEAMKAKVAAEASNRAKGEFLAMLGHDLRTPLGGVIGMAGLLLQSRLDDQQSEYVKTIISASESLLAVISDLLDISRIEAGQLTLEREPFELWVAVEEVVELLAAKACDHGLEIVCTIEPDVPAVIRGDRSRLRQVLTNLVDNAVKYTEEGTVTVHACPEADAEGEPRVRLEVSDTGIGIPEEAIPTLFEPFVRADGQRREGVGLGLAISRRLVNMMGSEIGLESERGRGTRVWFSVGAVGLAEPQRELLSRLEAVEGRSAVVVGEGPAAASLARQLRAWGAEIVGASGASDALGLVDEIEPGDADVPALLLLDELPRGSLAARALLKAAGDRSIPTVVLVDRGDPAAASEALALGADICLTRPVRPTYLHKALSGRASKPAEVRAPPVAPAGLRRVLVVEDDPINGRVVELMLRRLGYGADVVTSGFDALQRAAETSYDAILMDCEMPGMDGFETTRALRASESDGEHTPIIAMTARVMNADRQLCLAAGMDDYMSKPFVSHELGRILARWL